jgi:DNA damage-binding protein 2
MDLNHRREIALAADSFGFLYQMDIRANKQVGKPTPVHKKGTKVVGVDCHPVDADLFLTCGNDHKARIWDMRMLSPDNCLAQLNHPRVVTAAYFSPITGNKIMSTCLDNRIRVWDNLCADLSEPSREIVHSHNFNRYITSFKAEWDPKDRSECLAVIGRYISDDFNGVALHPIDFIDTSDGRLVEQVYDHSITTICTVNKFHPRLDCMATGSSRSLFIWRPKDEIEEIPEAEATTPEANGKKTTKIQIYEADGGKAGRAKGKNNNDDDDDFAFMKKKFAAKANANGAAGASSSCSSKKEKSKRRKSSSDDEDSEDEMDPSPSKDTPPSEGRVLRRRSK